MKVLLDTSVLIAAMVEAHPHHVRALPWLQRAKHKEITAVITCHSLAESYSILTTLPVHPHISPSVAWRLIQENILDVFTFLPLTGEDYRAVLEHLSMTGIIGGATYDALIAHTASKAKVDQLVTLNARDFHRIYPDLSEQIVEP
jgi:predicted nucleic acid-binding protein